MNHWISPCTSRLGRMPQRRAIRRVPRVEPCSSCDPHITDARPCLNPCAAPVTLTAFGGLSRAVHDGLPMITTITLGAAVLVIVVALTLWRLSRRVLSPGHLDDASVSRQWLLQHQ